VCNRVGKRRGTSRRRYGRDRQRNRDTTRNTDLPDRPVKHIGRTVVTDNDHARGAPDHDHHHTPGTADHNHHHTPGTADHNHHHTPGTANHNHHHTPGTANHNHHHTGTANHDDYPAGKYATDLDYPVSDRNSAGHHRRPVLRRVVGKHFRDWFVGDRGEFVVWRVVANRSWDGVVGGRGRPGGRWVIVERGSGEPVGQRF
jgi:hypothetical protein